ncbi:MAG: S-layer homology domain-containing protein [Gudongella sp.]|jgi:hypothetical protein|nr:S-layer homology domain-containing protein [Gudongella sp.]
MKRISIYILIILLLMQSSVSFAEVFEPGIPQNVMLGLDQEESTILNLSWINANSLGDYIGEDGFAVGLHYHVNLYIRYDDDVYSKDIYYNYNDFAEDESGRICISISPNELEVPIEAIDLLSTSYSIRVRYLKTMHDIIGYYNLTGGYSAIASLGLVYPYNYASSWAIEELDNSIKYGFITNRISSNMRDIITREEFSEMMVKLYESKEEDEEIDYGNPFFDTQNPVIAKAAGLGIIMGYEDGSFRPDNPISRQDIAVILYRTLQLMIPEFNTSYESRQIFEEISDYAYPAVMFLAGHDILRGDQNGVLSLMEHTTREQAVLLTLRAYEEFK